MATLIHEAAYGKQSRKKIIGTMYIFLVICSEWLSEVMRNERRKKFFKQDPKSYA